MSSGGYDPQSREGLRSWQVETNEVQTRSVTDAGEVISHCPGCAAISIPSGSVGVVQDLGKYVGWAEPGCVCFMPIWRSIEPISLAVQMLRCTSECKTKDSVIITVQTSVQYRVHKQMLKEALFDIVNPKNQIQAYVDSVLRSTLPSLDLDEAYSAKEKVCDEILRSVRHSMAKYGHEIINVLVTDLTPERGVQQAMNAINAAKRHREAAREQAEGQKVLAIKAAEADAEAKYLSGAGIARMRTAMAEGLKDSMETMAEGGLSPQEAMHMMVTTQYLDTLKDFAHNPTTCSVMVPHSSSGSAQDIEAQVRNGLFQAKAMGPPSQSTMA